MGTLETLEAIRREIARQARLSDLIVQKTEKPDAVHLIGELDLYELAKAIER